MEINVKKESKIVEVWLTQTEKNNPCLKESLKPLYKKYKAENYLVAVMQSGEGDLYKNTRDLLCYNRKRFAQLEVQQERQAGMSTIT